MIGRSSTENIAIIMFAIVFLSSTSIDSTIFIIDFNTNACVLSIFLALSYRVNGSHDFAMNGLFLIATADMNNDFENTIFERTCCRPNTKHRTS